jgi:glycosyltransferase involved in cell wall biosynthesis
LNVEEPRYIGGIERQLTTLARQLVFFEKTVAFVTFKHHSIQDHSVDGVDILTSFDPNAGVRGLRFFYPRAFRLVAAILRAKPRVVIQMGAGVETALSFIAARISGAKFCYLSASDADCNSGLPLVNSGMEKVAYKVGLKGADLVIAQTKTQEHALKQNFGVTSQKLFLPYVPSQAREVDSTQSAETSASTREKRVIWVGRVCPEKRPEWLLHSAQELPEIRFHMIGAANTDTEFSRSILDAAASVKNLAVPGRVKDSVLAQEFRAASLLACTSLYEGFPTTFLEAWSLGIPVVTSFDPDGLVAKHGLGQVVISKQDFVQAVGELTSGPDNEESRSLCKRFFTENFSPGACMPQLISSFENMRQANSA